MVKKKEIDRLVNLSKGFFISERLRDEMIAHLIDFPMKNVEPVVRILRALNAGTCVEKERGDTDRT